MIPEVTTQNKASSVVLWSNLSRAIFVCIEFLNLAVFFGDYNCYIMVCYGMLVSGLFKEEKVFFWNQKWFSFGNRLHFGSWFWFYFLFIKRWGLFKMIITISCFRKINSNVIQRIHNYSSNEGLTKERLKT